MISTIKPGPDAIAEFDFNPSKAYLTHLQQINVFIGVNNSGKSRLLRYLVNTANSNKYYTRTEDPQIYQSAKAKLATVYQQAKSQASQNRLPLNEEVDKALDISKIAPTDLNSIIEVSNRLSEISKKDFLVPHSYNESTLKQIISRFHSIKNEVYRQIDSITHSTGMSNIYIPVLRGLRPLYLESEEIGEINDVYLNRTTQDYFDQNSNTLVYTGLSLYEDIKKLLLGLEEERRLIADFELFLGRNVFDGKVTLIPKYGEDVLHVKVGESKQFAIYNLGDGLQTIITILFPVFRSRDTPSLVFIEEPETHLHPKWQRLLLRALKHFDKHAFFISTHSTSFINDTEASIYLVDRKEKKATVNYSNLEKEKVQIIKDLGYRPSDLFQSNYILWVEGPSDKIYLNYWIRTADSSLKEGLHYSIMFFGGDNYNEFLKSDNEFSLTFIKNLNQSFGIVLDSDRSKKTENYNLKKKEIQRLFESNSSFCWLTRRRTIENYIPLDVFKAAVVEQHKNNHILIEKGDFANRSVAVDKTLSNSFKATIKLPQELFRIVQKNKDGTTKGVSDSRLRKHIEESIQDTNKHEFKINKVKVAKRVVRYDPGLLDQELQKMINKLIVKIRKANND